jgi:alpha-galactosidase
MISLSFILLLTPFSYALPLHTVGKLPTLGWNSWNAFGCNVNETKVLGAANDFISLGLKDAGYSYVNVDDCWSNHTGRDSEGRIQPNMTIFPDGISGLATKVHDLGLNLGIYSDAGTETCGGYEGSLYHETTDAETFTSWGVDYLKYDNCYVPANWTDAANYTNWADSNSAIRYKRMSSAIAAVNKPLYLELCIWGDAEVWTWGDTVGLSWRMTGDITAEWSSITSIVAFNVMHLDSVGFYSHNDMDMMVSRTFSSHIEIEMDFRKSVGFLFSDFVSLLKHPNTFR